MLIAVRDSFDVGSITKYNSRSMMYAIKVSDLMVVRLLSVSKMVSCSSVLLWCCSECFVCSFKDSYTLVRKVSLNRSSELESNYKS